MVTGASATLGTFQPTPYIWVGGSHPTGSGYSPLGIYGDQTLSLYGPLSPLRAATAPVLVYARGYDGQLRVIEANSFSYPNLPSRLAGRLPDGIQLLLRAKSEPHSSLGIQRDQLDRSELTMLLGLRLAQHGEHKRDQHQHGGRAEPSDARNRHKARSRSAAHRYRALGVRCQRL